MGIGGEKEADAVLNLPVQFLQYCANQTLSLLHFPFTPTIPSSWKLLQTAAGLELNGLRIVQLPHCFVQLLARKTESSREKLQRREGAFGLTGVGAQAQGKILPGVKPRKSHI